MSRRLLAQILIIVLLLAGIFVLRRCQQARAEREAAARTETRSEKRDRSPKEDTARPTSTAKIPAYALDVLRYVQANDKAPQGYVGGREFQNRENRLPEKSPSGRVVRYREWDVHPKTAGKNRGAERLITGSDGSAWFTDDHYKTFKNITEGH